MTCAGPLTELLPDEELDEPAAGVPAIIGVLVPAGIEVLDEELEELELEDELEVGLVGHRAFPVTGTTGVVVPELGMTGVVVPAAPLGALGEGVPAEVLGLLAVDVPALGMAGVVVPELEAEVGEVT